MRVDIQPDPLSAAERAAELIAEALRRGTSRGRRCSWAMSGGATAVPMLEHLGDLDLAWALIDTWQVDERIAPEGHEDRNRTSQLAALPAASQPRIRWLPVEDPSPDQGAARYAGSLPRRFDVVHLGIGRDGHTASLVPGDPVLQVEDRDVAVTRPYRGRRRMTLTYSGLARADHVIWLITGSRKKEALEKLIAGDRSIPAAGVPVSAQTIVTDVREVRVAPAGSY